MRRLVLNCRDDRPMWAPPADLAQRVAQAVSGDWQVDSVNAAVSSRGDGGAATSEALDAMRGAEVYIGAGLPRELLLAGTPTLRWAHSTTAGIASFLYPENDRVTGGVHQLGRDSCCAHGRIGAGHGVVLRARVRLRIARAGAP